MASNKAIIESLWGLGVDEATLRGISTAGGFGKFDDALRTKGIDPALISKAQRLADWRPSKDRTTRDNLVELMRLTGATDDQVKATFEQFKGKTYTADQMLAAATGTLGDQMGTNLAIKLGVKPSTNQWNPFRGDAPPDMATPSAPSAVRPGGGPRMRITGPGQPPSPGPIPQQDLGGSLGGGGTNVQAIVDQALAAKADLTVEDVDEIIKSAYGFSAYALEIPEVKSLLQKAANEDWDETRIKGALTTTNFWKTTSDAQRGWMALKAQDPATADRRLREQKANVQGTAKKLGFEVDDRRLDQITNLSLQWGWSAEQTQSALASEFRFDPTGKKSQLGINLKRRAGDFVVPMSDQALQQWGQQIISGTATEEDFDAYLAEQAKSMFPGLGVALDRGITVRQYADPYVQIAAKNLEINPDSIDLTDTKWLRALNQVDPKTGERTSMSLTDWEDTLKTDPRYGWDKTKQAQRQASDLAATIAKTFGKI